MVYTGIFATEAELDAKAGENVGVTGWTEANKNDYIAQAESYINNVSRRNWTDIYNDLDVDVKKTLSEAASNLSAIYGIQYNMSGFSSRIEAEDMINILFARFVQCIDLLQDDRTVNFINSTEAPDGENVLTTKGDLLTFDITKARLAVGSDGQIIVADSTESKGIKWADPGTEIDSFTAGENLVNGDLTYYKSDGKFWKVDADAEVTSKGRLAIAQETISADAAGLFLLKGSHTTSGLTVADELFVSTTAGTWTNTKPSATADIVRLIGYSISTTVLFFDPDKTYIEIA